MKQKTYQITKPEYNNEIYSKIQNLYMHEENFNYENLNIKEILYYKLENNKNTIIFCDLLNKLIFNYSTPETDDYKIDCIMFENETEILNYLKQLLEQFKYKENIYTSSLKDEIKKCKLYIESKKNNNIKELTKEKNTIKLNDILYTSWGYDQTNVEMFRIIKILGKNYFIIQEITKQKIEGSENFMSQDVTAGDEDCNTLPIKAFICNKGYMSICETGYKRSLFKHNKGDKHYNSWYAWGK